MDANTSVYWELRPPNLRSQGKMDVHVNVHDVNPRRKKNYLGSSLSPCKMTTKRKEWSVKVLSSKCKNVTQEPQCTAKTKSQKTHWPGNRGIVVQPGVEKKPSAQLLWSFTHTLQFLGKVSPSKWSKCPFFSQKKKPSSSLFLIPPHFPK